MIRTKMRLQIIITPLVTSTYRQIGMDCEDRAVLLHQFYIVIIHRLRQDYDVMILVLADNLTSILLMVTPYISKISSSMQQYQLPFLDPRIMIGLNGIIIRTFYPMRIKKSLCTHPYQQITQVIMKWQV